MKRPWLTRIFPLALTAVLIFARGAVWAQQDSPQDAAQANAQRSDGEIEMDVVKALDDSQALKNDLITAATIQSQVTLSGTVSSEASKRLAESKTQSTPWEGRLSSTATRRSGFGKGGGRSRIPFTMLKMRALAPMPRASVRTEQERKPGLRRRVRKA